MSRSETPVKKHEFKVGDKVEVMSNEEGFLGSYYQAKIVSYFDNGQYVVEYKNLLEDDESKPLRETRFFTDLRPYPPTVRDRDYDYNQLVDAYDNDGWWVGKITTIYPPEKKKGTWRYRVYFPTTDEDIWYPGKRIRAHQEWDGEGWIR